MWTNMRRNLILGIAITLLLAGRAPAQQPAGVTVRIDQHAIGGAVTREQGSEAGVGGIAEPHSLPTRLLKIVVTDGRGPDVDRDQGSAAYAMGGRGNGR